MGAISSALSIGSAASCRITNLSVPFANNEVSHVLVDGCKYLEINARNTRTITKLAFTLGDSSTIYKTIQKGNAWFLAGMSFNSKTLYVQCDQANEILEIVELY